MSDAAILDLPPQRRADLERVAGVLRHARRVAISTHINADGDGCGSEAALVRMLAQLGVRAFVVNPTPWPAMYDFLRGEDVEDRSAAGGAALADADVLAVLDINDLRRLGTLADAARRLTVPRVVIDHHVPGAEPAGELVAADTRACATGELIFDLAAVLGVELTEPAARALYVAILTDTGGFRFSNTSPRCHAIAARLLAAGVDPEAMYRRVYASVPVGRLHLLREALESLHVEPALGLSWISLSAQALSRHGVTAEDLDGIVEHPRSIAGTRLALLFRDLGHGKVKVSFRSTGDVDVSRFAQQFGGGGHAKASGALVPGSLAEVEARVLGAARAFLRDGHTGPVTGPAA